MNYAISDAANLRIKENDSGNIALYTPYANQTNAEFTSSQVYANAKGSRAVRFDHDKQGQLMCEFEVFDLKWLSIILGASSSEGTVDIAQRDVLTANASNTVTLTDTPKTGSLAIFLLEEDNVSHGTEQTLTTGTLEANKFTISGDVVTFFADSVPEGTKVVAYYLKDSVATAEQYSIKADEYPVSYEVIGDAMMKRKHDGVTEYIQFNCPNATPIGELTISMEAGGITNLSVNFDLFGDANNDMMLITKL